MTNIENLYKHHFVLEILKDTSDLGFSMKSQKVNADTEIEYYINNSAFYLVHLISLLEQLNNAVELFSNYSYKQKNEIDRGKHLTYNYENFIIRFCSISDRLLQVINAVYYLGVNEKDVKVRSILNNDKIIITDIPSKFKELNKIINKYIGDRNQVIHRHSFDKKELKRIEMFYNPEIFSQYSKKSSFEEIDQFKTIRTIALTSFIKKTKTDFRDANNVCIEKIHPILDELHLEYKRIKSKL